MFSYNENRQRDAFFVTIQSDLKYNFAFLNCMTELMSRIQQSDCKNIYFVYHHELKDSGKMALVYFYNTIRFFIGDKSLFLNKRLFALVEQKITYADENKFEKIDIAEKLASDLLQCYHFNNDKSVNQTAQLLVDFIAEKNLIFEDVKEFLITTWAIQPGNTTRSGSGGYGLPTLVDYVSKVKGELLIFSGECLYALKGTSIHILDSKGYFFGTSVSMKIPVFDNSNMILYDKEQNEIISINLDEL